MLNENKIFQYIVYAIGEIALVVIGIIIALQINTWNEDRVNKSELKSILRTVKANMISDNNASLNNSGNDSDVTDYLTNFKQNPDNDSLALNFIKSLTMPYIPNDNAGYRTAISNNKISLITNETLKSDIINYYESSYLDSQRFIDYLFETYSVIYAKTLDESIKYSYLKTFPKRMSKLIKDPSFEEMINSYMRLQKIVINNLNERRGFAEKIIKMIDHELKE